MVTFLHLTDIHFYHISNEAVDIDKRLRASMQEDILAMSGKLGGIDGILVTGDVADRGLPDEYAVAGEWLKELARSLSINEANIWMVPGNHDVCRDRITEAMLPHRCAVNRENQAGIARKLSEAPAVFTEPVQNYNDFAARFGSAVDPNSFCWTYESSDMDTLPPLEDGSLFYMRGLNTALASDQHDMRMLKDLEDGGSRHAITVNMAQCVLPNLAVPPSFVLVLGHHPPQWWRQMGDGHPADHMKGRTHLQVYGHIHQFMVEDNDSGLIIIGGAVNPSRSHDWRPGYCIIRVHAASDKHFEVDIIPRCCKTAHEFDYDDQAPPSTYQIRRQLDGPPTKIPYVRKRTAPSPQLPKIDARRIMLELLASGRTRFERVFHALGLAPTAPEDRLAGGIPFYQRAFQNLVAEGRLDEIREEMLKVGIGQEEHQ